MKTVKLKKQEEVKKSAEENKEEDSIHVGKALIIIGKIIRE